MSTTNTPNIADGPNFKSDPMTTEVFKTEIGIHTMEFPKTCIKNPCKEITYKTKDAIKNIHQSLL